MCIFCEGIFFSGRERVVGIGECRTGREVCMHAGRQDSCQLRE